MMGYTGSHGDTCSNAYILGAGYRFYSPALMRFTSSDDWSPFGLGGIHPYVYCDDDPINRHDPSGHAPWSWIRKLARSIGFGNSTPTAAKDATAAARSTGQDSSVVITSGRHIGAAEPPPNYRKPPHQWEPTEEEIDDEQEELARRAEGRQQAFDDMMAPIRQEAALRLAREHTQYVSAQRRIAELLNARPSRTRSNSIYGRYPYPGEIDPIDRTRTRLQFNFLTNIWRARVSHPAPFASEAQHSESLEILRMRIDATLRQFVSSQVPYTPGLSARTAFNLTPY